MRPQVQYRSERFLFKITLATRLKVLATGVIYDGEETANGAADIREDRFGVKVDDE